METVNVFWFRRDLRLHDNAGLAMALGSGKPVLPVFIFDRHILDDLERPEDRRVEFIHRELTKINDSLGLSGSALLVYYGTVEESWKQILENWQVEAVYTNEDYEPYARKRDTAVSEMLAGKGISFHAVKDHVVFSPEEVLKDDGSPYTVYTPYSKKWKQRRQDHPDCFQRYPSESMAGNFLKWSGRAIPSLESMGFRETGFHFPPDSVGDELIRNYAETRDIPSLNGTSRLGLHLRFGTVSIRETMCSAEKLNEKFLNELIWREFYQQILWHFPQVVTQSFRQEYDRIEWRNNEAEFEKWKYGQTGYPIVDAGMRELLSTGYMHNRVRMIAASFLCKHLLIDWRWGEAWFAKHLLDFDLASNNGGWQWSAGCGVDAAPYFRVFNPYLQTLKFDAQLRYIRRWVPEYDTLKYPQPMVNHEFARKRCLEVYGRALGKELIANS